MITSLPNPFIILTVKEDKCKINKGIEFYPACKYTDCVWIHGKIRKKQANRPEKEPFRPGERYEDAKIISIGSGFRKSGSIIEKRTPMGV